MPVESLTLRVLDAISEVSEAEWDAVAGPDAVPFTRWGWIHSLESSGSASRRTGWEPSHLTLWRGPRLVAAAAAWRKFHSMGEYVYDFSWANAAEQMGISYYPKLLIGIPLSPITAPRFMVLAGEDVPALRKALLDGAVALARETRCSSVHVIFPPREEALALESHGLAARTGMQYHWKNPGYATYDDYLARFGSKRRNQLRRERAAAEKQGIRIATVRGAGLTPVHADLAYRFYEATNSKNGWGRLQLNRDFFLDVFRRLGESLEVVEATRDGRVVGGAFNVAHGDRLYGRYWGCFEEFPFLHFNVCLYHSVDESIRLGRKVFEPGAGGEHKISRGFEPTAIWSAHRIFDPRLEAAVRDFVVREQKALAPYLETATEIAGMKPWT